MAEVVGTLPVAAVVVLVPGAQLTEQNVLALLDGRIARFKMPRRVLFRDNLPKTALGKVQKSILLAALDDVGSAAGNRPLT